jgi:hypothetical protein
MEDKIIKILKTFRHIEPDSRYKERSRAQILASSVKGITSSVFTEIFETLKFSLALGLGSMLIIFVLGSLLYFGSSRSSSLATPESSVSEFRIQLKEAKYFDEVIKEIADADKEIEKLLSEIIL